MLTIEERIALSKERTRQLEIQKRVKENSEAQAKRKLDIRRNSEVGKIVSKYFTELLKYQPRRSNAENAVEFALLDAAVSLIAADREYVSRIVEKAKAVQSEERKKL